MEVGSKSIKGKVVLEENNEFKETRAGVEAVSLPGRLAVYFYEVQSLRWYAHLCQSLGAWYCTALVLALSLSIRI